MREATIYNLLDRQKLNVYFPDGGTWVRGWLKEELGIRADWKRDPKTGLVWWQITKTKQEALTTALRSRYAGVWLIRQYSEKVICTTACQAAKRDECICSCAGEFHRGGGDWQYVTDQFMVNDEVKQVVRHYKAPQ
ncbi:hypothetical protein AB0323_13390 [Arthrobacter sp. NPDC080031]|uniref:hypothetical protein n=1 Tax=Arthrobacter sp. NPDC080031 TaxID=3155918 RepID=UPI00344B777D